MGDNEELVELPLRKKYERNSQIDEQVTDLLRESLSYVERFARIPYGQPGYIYTEALVELFFRRRDETQQEEAKRLLAVILKRVKVWAYRLCKQAAVPDCEECSNEIVSEVGMQLAQGNLDSHYFWCCNFIAALKRTFSKYLQRLKRQQGNVISLEAAAYEDAAAPIETTADCEADIITQALNRLSVEKLFQALTPKQTRIVKLLRDGYSQAEIANELNCTDRTVRNMIQRIKQVMIDHEIAP